MQKNMFVGNLTKNVVLSGSGTSAIARFTLMTSEYAGKDSQTGQAKERTVAIQFTAFASRAEIISKNCLKGDQLIIEYRVENNNYEKEGLKIYSHNFIVEDFKYGAPGKEKRNQLNRAGGA